MEPSMESEKINLTAKPHSTIRKEGFPLDSISLEINTNKYFYDLPEDKLEQVAVEDGFLEFFKNIYCVCEKDSFIPGEIKALIFKEYIQTDIINIKNQLRYSISAD